MAEGKFTLYKLIQGRDKNKITNLGNISGPRELIASRRLAIVVPPPPGLA